MTIYMCVFAVCVTAIIIAYMLITQNSNENSNVNLTFEKKDEPQIYGNEYNCIMTMFGDCSYAETGCGSCKVVEKVRKALEKYEPKTEPNSSEKPNNCDTCRWGEWYKQGYDITMMSDECGGCCSWNNKWTPLYKCLDIKKIIKSLPTRKFEDEPQTDCAWK